MSTKNLGVGAVTASSTARRWSSPRQCRRLVLSSPGRRTTSVESAAGAGRLVELVGMATAEPSADRLAVDGARGVVRSRSIALPPSADGGRRKLNVAPTPSPPVAAAVRGRSAEQRQRRRTEPGLRQDRGGRASSRCSPISASSAGRDRPLGLRRLKPCEACAGVSRAGRRQARCRRRCSTGRWAGRRWGPGVASPRATRRRGGGESHQRSAKQLARELAGGVDIDRHRFGLEGVDGVMGVGDGGGGGAGNTRHFDGDSLIGSAPLSVGGHHARNSRVKVRRVEHRAPVFADFGKSPSCQ